MQSVSSNFTTRTSASVRPLNWSFAISWTKEYDPDIDFFTVGSSRIGHGNILKGVNDVVQEWDKFDYIDFSERVIRIEYNREADPPLSALTLATAEITLDNSDDYFTPGNEDSEIFGYVLPRRPVRVQIGFGTEVVPIFVGVTEGIPIISEREKVARIRCVDVLSSIINKPLDEAALYQDMTSSEIISELLQTHGGLLESQINIDLGTITIPFAYFESGSKLGDALQQIAEADLGNISCDEAGVIRFQNRINWIDNTKVWQFDRDSVLEMQTPDDEKIINVVEVFSNVREVQANKQIYELGAPVEIPAGGSAVIFANFEDDDGALPVTSVDSPSYSATPISASFYSTNAEIDGSGDAMDSDISLDSTSIFSTAYKLTFSNTAGVPVYITALVLYGTPAEVVQNIYVREQNDDSVGTQDGFDERPFRLENNYIQTEANAQAIADLLIEDRGTFLDQREMLVKGVPQLQIGDVVGYNDDKMNNNYFVTRINGMLDSQTGFRQFIEMSERTFTTFFRIEVSEIEGDDVIGP